MIFMESIFALIDERVSKYLSNSSYVVSAPCVVKALNSNGLVDVELVSNKSKYTVPNWSGSNVEVGENVQLFYRGNILSNQTAYIGASANKGDNSTAFNNIGGEIITGELSNSESLLSDFAVTNHSKSFILNVNLTFQGDENNNGSGTILVYIDGTEQSYSPVFSVIANGYQTLSFSLPMNLVIGSHYIEVKGTGLYAELISGCVFAFGNIEGYYPTDENDYIYIIEDGEATIVQYIGNSICPLVPTKLEGATVTTIASGAFTNTDVIDVCIPEGITTIE